MSFTEFRWSPARVWSCSTCIRVSDNGRVMCGEASGSGAKIGVELGFGDVEAELCLDTIGNPRADQSSAFAVASKDRPGIVSCVILG
jgi:hypothetical protein